MAAELQKAMDRTFNHAMNTFVFRKYILILSKGEELKHEKLVKKALENLDEENLALKISKYDFFQNEVDW